MGLELNGIIVRMESKWEWNQCEDWILDWNQNEKISNHSHD